MARRDFDFSPAQKVTIIAYFGVCAACGADDSLQADHWIAGDSADEGVCLCHHCNVTVKRNIYIPECYRLPCREPLNVITHSEYKAQVAANREAFAKWVSMFKYFVKGKDYRSKKIGPFNPAF